MLLTEFDKKKFARTMKKEGYEEGVKDGAEKKQREIILHVLQSHSPEETANFLGFPLEQILAIANISSGEK